MLLQGLPTFVLKLVASPSTKLVPLICPFSYFLFDVLISSGVKL